MYFAFVFPWLCSGLSLSLKTGVELKILVLDSLEDVAQKSLEYVQGPRVAVSGGTTFAALFRHWLPEVKRKVGAGETLGFFPVDERAVPFENPQCNWKVCCEELLIPAGLAAQRNHHVTTALQYEELLRREFAGDPVVFDQIFLGMGEDGHTASLFPGGSYLQDRTSIVLDVVGPKPPPQRVTLGFKPLKECETLVAIALGASKASMVKRLCEGDAELPIAIAMAGHGNAVLLLDRAAAGLT